MDEERIVLVDREGRPCGTIGKMEGHVAPGAPHLAFSLVIVAPDGTMLLQRRSQEKHHFRGRWSNSCCSHPRPGESVVSAATRRAQEELGMSITDVEEIGSFWYRAIDPETGLVEHELDTVLTARAEGPARPDATEVADVAWDTLASTRRRCLQQPASVTPWLAGVLDVLDGARP